MDYIFDEDNLTLKYGDATLHVVVDENDNPKTLTEMNTMYEPDRAISLEVRDTPIVNQLKKWGFTIPPSSRKLDRFFAVVEALQTIHTKTDHTKWGNKIIKGIRWKKPIADDPPQYTRGKFTGGSTLGDKKNIQGGFLKIAKLAGTLGETGESEIPETAKAKTKPAQRMEYDFKKFQGEWTDREEYEKHKEKTGEKNYVYEWQNTVGKFKDKGTPKAKTLYKALALLDLSPEEFLRASKNPSDNMQTKSNDEKVKWLTERLNKKTFTPAGKQQKIFSDKPMSLIDWTGMSRPVPTLVDKMVKNPKTGKMELKTVTFSKERSKTYDAMTGKGAIGVQKALTKVLRHLAESHGVSGAWGGLWSQKTPISVHGKLNLSATELERFEKCLKKKPKFNEKGIYTFVEEDEEDRDEDGVPKKKTYNSTEADWDDAYLYYRIGMDMGWRAEEGFTAVGNPPKNPAVDSGVIDEGWKDMREDFILKIDYGYKGEFDREEMDAFYAKLLKEKTEKYMELYPEDQAHAKRLALTELTELRADVDQRKITTKVLALQIMTRKTAHVRDIIHKGYIQNEETKDLIKAKMEKIAKGASQKTQKEADKFGVVLKYEDKEARLVAGKWQSSGDFGKLVTNNHHALIGSDGKYITVGTMAYGANPKFSKAERDLFKEKGWDIPKVRPKQHAVNQMRAIFRICYKESMEEGQQLDNYFLNHSLHAIRHLFAQFWIKASKKDFTFVRDLGHWGGTDVLENFYGRASGSETLELQIRYGKKKFSTLIEEEEDKEKTKETDEKTDKFLDANTDENNDDQSGDEPNLNEEGEPIVAEETVSIEEEEK